MAAWGTAVTCVLMDRGQRCDVHVRLQAIRSCVLDPASEIPSCSGVWQVQASRSNCRYPQVPPAVTTRPQPLNSHHNLGAPMCSRSQRYNHRRYSGLCNSSTYTSCAGSPSRTATGLARMRRGDPSNRAPPKLPAPALIVHPANVLFTARRALLIACEHKRISILLRPAAVASEAEPADPRCIQWCPAAAGVPERCVLDEVSLPGCVKGRRVLIDVRPDWRTAC